MRFPFRRKTTIQTRLAPFPLAPGWLERFRLRANRFRRPGLQGGHLTRRQGSSLEFREFTPYAPGDDVRHVDWRTSARFGDEHDLLVRRFVAEERLTLAVSVDLRPSMRLPQGLPKLQIAAWLAEALSRVALANGDRVLLHGLFCRGDAVETLVGSHATHRVRSSLERWSDPANETAHANLEGLRRALPPASVWVLISDLYFSGPEQIAPLARFFTTARMGFRWLLLVDLDAWPMEHTLLGSGPRLVQGPNLAHPDPRFDIDTDSLARVAQRIQRAKQAFLQQIHLAPGGYHTWSWPQTSRADGSRFFRERLAEDTLLQRLFMKDSG